MPLVAIDDPHDPRLDPYRSIQDRDREGSEGRPGRFIGESHLVVRAMLGVPGCVESILAAERHAAAVEQMIGAARAMHGHPAHDVTVYIVPAAIVQPLTGFNLHRGLLAVGRRPQTQALESIVDMRPGAGPLLCVEAVNNMDNIGQLFRVAAAFGCSGALLSPTCHDPLYRKSLRVSCGHALTVPFARSERWTEDLSTLRDRYGFTVVGATGAGAQTLHELASIVHRPGSRRLALLVGAEYDGLTADALALCHHRVRIPMAHGVDSLNVAVAAAVFLSHITAETQR